MRWQGRRESRNVEDIRGSSGGGGFGGGMPGGFGRGGGFRIPSGGGGRGPMLGGGRISIWMLIIIGVVLWFLGINPLVLLDGGSGGIPYDPGQTTQAPRAPSPGGQVATRNADPSTGAAPSETADEMKRFVSVVLAETEDVWQELFKAAGKQYRDPTLVLFSGGVSSACGFASSASGPFYCPGDNKVYLDTAFFAELDRRFGAPGDFAQAYVIAHEVGHHVQNQIGVLPKFNQMRQRMSEAEANAMSVRVELQADCFAGVWAHFTDQKGILEAGDLEEALNAAQQIGDDTLQKRMQGYVVPESFNHGTSEQRQRWFRKGYDAGRADVCDTFNVDRV